LSLFCFKLQFDILLALLAYLLPPIKHLHPNFYKPIESGQIDLYSSSLLPWRQAVQN
jgi:hypothetical protein